MWFLTLITLVNALAHNEGFALRYRIEAGGLPISVFDALLALGVVYGIVGRRSAWPTERAHPLVGWIVGLFAAGAFAGVLGALISNAELRWMITGMRNFLALPAGVLIGYCLLFTPRSNTRFCYLQVIAGIGTAVLVLLFFRSKAASYELDSNINKLRAVAYVSNYAGLAAALVLFTIISKIRMFPTWLALGICGLCFVGQFATLTRSDWLAAIASVLAIFALVPTYRPGGKLVAALVGPPLIAVFLWVGLILASTVVGRDFEGRMAERVMSLVPGHAAGTHAQAWDTRLEGIRKELQLWAHSPIIGGGFGATDVLRFRRGEQAGLSYRHNSWTSTLADAGLPGLAAISCLIFGMIVVGRRLARDGIDRGYVLIGALAVITGVHYLFHGLATQSFNQMRWGIPLSIVCGVALRARAMQLTHMRVLQAEAAAGAYGPAEIDPGASAYDSDDYGAHAPAPAPAGAYASDLY